MNIYLLQCSITKLGDNYEVHKENVFSSLEMARKVGVKYLEEELRNYYNEYFDNGCPKEKELTKDELFSLSIIYDFSITEFDPYVTDKIEKFEYKYDEYFLHEPTHKVYSYNYNGELSFIEIQYKTIHHKHNRINIIMKPSDFEEGAGKKFKIGDIVEIKPETSGIFEEYQLSDKLHVITKVPKKRKGQKYFDNSYDVITNHNLLDNGCHEDRFRENEIRLYEGTVDEDSPIKLLSRIYKGKIKISSERRMDLITGRIALNDAPSFRDIKELK